MRGPISRASSAHEARRLRRRKPRRHGPPHPGGRGAAARVYPLRGRQPGLGAPGGGARPARLRRPVQKSEKARKSCISARRDLIHPDNWSVRAHARCRGRRIPATISVKTPSGYGDCMNAVEIDVVVSELGAQPYPKPNRARTSRATCALSNLADTSSNSIPALRNASLFTASRNRAVPW